jgi:hypothetical protein
LWRRWRRGGRRAATSRRSPTPACEPEPRPRVRRLPHVCPRRQPGCACCGCSQAEGDGIACVGGSRPGRSAASSVDGRQRAAAPAHHTATRPPRRAPAAAVALPFVPMLYCLVHRRKLYHEELVGRAKEEAYRAEKKVHPFALHPHSSVRLQRLCHLLPRSAGSSLPLPPPCVCFPTPAAPLLLLCPLPRPRITHRQQPCPCPCPCLPLGWCSAAARARILPTC